MGAQGTVEDNDDEEWRRVFDVNVFGMVRVSRAALPYLRESSRAAIVNTCSIAATRSRSTPRRSRRWRRSGTRAWSGRSGPG
ncbi:SDR family NAD(P)-dependent oxidoreductase [Actinomadura viridis]|uniref:SDR family NAD(P)-dependent oxidoreductase n=1 Tax=Actinomadura viridis TaxID=58110 RepID=UPI00369492BB